MESIRDFKARKILVSFDSVIPLLGTYSEKIIVKGEKNFVHTKVFMGNLVAKHKENNKNWKHSNVKQ